MSVQGTGKAYYKVGDKLRENQQLTRGAKKCSFSATYKSKLVGICRPSRMAWQTSKQGKKNIGADTCHWKTDLQLRGQNKKSIQHHDYKKIDSVQGTYFVHMRIGDRER